MMLDWALPIVFKVVHPVRGLNQRWSLPNGCISEAHPIGCSAIFDLLRHADGTEVHRIDFDGLRDVLEVPKPQLLAGKREFFEQVIMCLARNANSARFGYTLKPCGDVHAIAVNIVIIDDDVAEVYANPKFDPLIDTYPGVPLAHAALHFNGASYRVNHRRELDQHAVPGRLDDTASMFFDFRIDQRLPMPLQLSERAFLIHAHKTAVAGHIRSHNCCKPALHDASSNNPAHEPFRTRPSSRISGRQRNRDDQGLSALH